MRADGSSIIFKAGLLALSLAGVARAAAIDDFETAAGWSASVNGSATLSLGSIPGRSGNALRLIYSLSGGDYVQIVKDVSRLDLRTDGANALRFAYKAQGVANTLEIKLTDSDTSSPGGNDKLDYRLTIIADGQWRTMDVPFPAWTPFLDGPDDTFQLSRAAHLTVGVLQKDAQIGSGILWVDDVRLVRLSSYTYVLDAFGTSGANARSNSTVFVEPPSPSGGSSASLAYQAGFVVSPSSAAQFDFTVGSAAGSYAALISSFTLSPVVVTANTRLQFYVRGQDGGEAPKIQVFHSTPTFFPSWDFEVLPLTNYGTVSSTTFTLFSIPLSDFGGVGLDNVWAVKFVFDSTGTTGRVYIDDMAFVELGLTEEQIFWLDDMNFALNESLWEPFKHDLAASALDMPHDFSASQPDGGNRVMKLDYSFPTVTDILWAVGQRDLRPNPFAEQAFVFSYKGTGTANSLEFKAEDASGVVYSRRLANSSNSEDVWRTVRIPLKDMSPFGTSSSLNLKKIKNIYFAVSKGSGGSGVVLLDGLETDSASGKLNIDRRGDGDAVVQVLEVENPVSPNGDGIRDAASFVLRLREDAAVRLTVFNLRGVPLRKFDLGLQAAGVVTVVWDAKDDDGRLVPNGLYYFRAHAETPGGREDDVRHLIGVVR